jgi:hypothetical protein
MHAIERLWSILSELGGTTTQLETIRIRQFWQYRPKRFSFTMP